jgi:two-component system cell cycle sensor histidine kinase/response regulator CckA
MRSKQFDEEGLREHAERLIAAGTVARPIPDGEDTLHELLVYQTELEMQNEALRDAQAELAESETRYRNLFDHAPVAYVVLDASSIILSANTEACELLGGTPAGRRLTQFLVADEAIAFERFRRDVLFRPERLSAEFTLIDARSHRREIRIDAIRTSDEGSEWRAALVDQSVQKVALRKLNHSERLGALGQHASSVLHDLNNLLFSMAGHVDIALHFLPGDHPANRALEQLRNVVGRCANTLEQLASFSRAEVAPAPIIDLNAVLAQAEVVSKSLLGPDIQFELRLTATDASVRMDAAHVEQVLLTAVRNARQAMPHGGMFRIETSNLLGQRPADGRAALGRYLRWTMTDTGIGMTEGTRRRAFEAFFTTKPVGVGTGLGLSLVMAVVERAGGSALLESEVGRGTTLTVHLPCASAASLSSRPPPEPRVGAMTVMLVERTPEIRARIAARLSDAGCDVLATADVAEALHQLKKLNDRLAVLLVDEVMPGSVEEEFLGVVRVIAPFVEVVVASLATSDTGLPLDDAALDAIAETVLAAVSRLSP